MDRETLKKWFQRGKKPTESQFAELIDSFRHVDEKLKVSDVENLAGLIGGKMERTEAIEEFAAQSAAIEQLSEEKTSAEDVERAIAEYHAPQEWTQDSNLNDYTDSGIYHFKGYRTNANDNLPIESVGDVVNIAFTLIVDAHEGKLEGSTHIPCIVSQTLFLGNRQGSETKAYVRNATIFHDGQADKWEPWRELMQTTYLGVLRETHEGETLKSVTENGLYTGAFFFPSSTFDIFKLEVMNNYAMADVYGGANTVFQKITILQINGEDKELTRRGTWNGSGYDWNDWAGEKATETAGSPVEKARQNSLGVVMGGKNVSIDTDGGVNVEALFLKRNDTNTDDGVLNDSKLRIDNSLTVDTAMHTYQNKQASELSIVEEEGLWDCPITTGNGNRDFETVTAITKIAPNSTTVLVKDIWRKAYDRFLYLCKNNYSDYSASQILKCGIMKYPYYQGWYIFQLKTSLTSNVQFYLVDKNNTLQIAFENKGGGVYQANISNFIERYEEVETGVFQPVYTNDLSKLLPFRIEVEYAGNSAWSYDGVELTIETYEKASTEVYNSNNGRYLFGRFQKIVEGNDGYTDQTHNVVVCSDGILLQGSNQACYIKITPDGNIETNLGQFITT